MSVEVAADRLLDLSAQLLREAATLYAVTGSAAESVAHAQYVADCLRRHTHIRSLGGDLIEVAADHARHALAEPSELTRAQLVAALRHVGLLSGTVKRLL